MTEEDDVWLGGDDLGTVKKGDVIKSIYRALTVFGLADHVDKNGNWRNLHDALLIPAQAACFQIMQTGDDIAVELMPTQGTMIAVTFDHIEHVLIWSTSTGWSYATSGEPVDADSHWDSWRVITGQVTRVGD